MLQRNFLGATAAAQYHNLRFLLIPRHQNHSLVFLKNQDNRKSRTVKLLQRALHSFRIKSTALGSTGKKLGGEGTVNDRKPLNRTFRIHRAGVQLAKKD